MPCFKQKLYALLTEKYEHNRTINQKKSRAHKNLSKHFVIEFFIGSSHLFYKETDKHVPKPTSKPTHLLFIEHFTKKFQSAQTTSYIRKIALKLLMHALTKSITIRQAVNHAKQRTKLKVHRAVLLQIEASCFLDRKNMNISNNQSNKIFCS